MNADNNLEAFCYFLPKLRGIRRLGAASYDLCLVARGVFDAYWELNLSPWDVCAGSLIVEEAGGKVGSYRSDRGVSILAAHQTIYQQFADYLSRPASDGQVT